MIVKKRIADILVAYNKLLYATASPMIKRRFTLQRLASRLLSILKFLPFSCEAEPCDILLLHSENLTHERTQHLSEMLEQRGFHVKHIVLSVKNLLMHRMFYPPDDRLPGELFRNAAFAKFLAKKYQPKVLCTFTHSAASFLRREVHDIGGKSLYIAHGYTPSEHDYSIFDYDYYFMFGRGSLDNALTNNVRIGATNAVLTGSPFVSIPEVLPPNYEKKTLLFFSLWATWLPESDPTFLKNTHIVLEWAKLHPEFHLLIKLHPLENPESICKLTTEISNISVLDKTTSMVDALRKVSAVVSWWSTATIEAALLQRPIVVVNEAEVVRDFLSLEKFFLPRARTVEELHQNIVQTFARYDEFLQNTRAFARYHLEHATDSVEFMADCIASIYHDNENFPCIPINEELSGLKPYMNAKTWQRVTQEQNSSEKSVVSRKFSAS